MLGKVAWPMSFSKVFARGEAWKVSEGGGDREVSLEKLKNLKNLNVFKEFLQFQLKNLKKLFVLLLFEPRGLGNLTKH